MAGKSFRWREVDYKTLEAMHLVHQQSCQYFLVSVGMNGAVSKICVERMIAGPSQIQKNDIRRLYTADVGPERRGPNDKHVPVPTDEPEGDKLAVVSGCNDPRIDIIVICEGSEEIVEELQPYETKELVGEDFAETEHDHQSDFFSDSRKEDLSLTYAWGAWGAGKVLVRS